MRLWPHGVSILSVDVDGDRMGVTVSSLVSLSLEPPLIGVSIGKDASCYELLRSAGRFAVSLLGSEQEELARRFAAGYPPIVHWQGVPTREGQIAPLIEGALGWIEAQTQTEADAGTTRSSSPTSSRSSTAPRIMRSSTARAPTTACDEAVVFDLDGVLLQSEEVWDAVRERYVRERGGRYDEEVQRAMMGMSAPEWSRFLHDEADVPDDPETINRDVVARMLEAYRRELPLLAGREGGGARAAAAFRSRSRRRPTARCSRKCSSSPGRADCFRATSRPRRSNVASRHRMSTSRRPGGSSRARAFAPRRDSHAGIRSAKSAGMRVVAIPNASYPPAKRRSRSPTPWSTRSMS
jgi:hypothetical protein